MDGYYSDSELKKLGFKSCGKNVLISKKTSIYLPEKISIGSNVRIDDFCFLLGDITLGNYIHIAPYCGIHGSGGGSVTFEDYSAISSGTTIYAGSDDYSGQFMTNPMVPIEYRNNIFSHIRMGKHSITGVSCVILPGAELAEGVAVGAMSLVRGKTEPWGIYAGIPCKWIKNRSKKALLLEEEFVNKHEK